MFQAAADIIKAGCDLFGSKLIAGFLLDKADNNQRNEADKDMGVDSLLTENKKRPNIQVAFRHLEVILDIRQAAIYLNDPVIRHIQLTGNETVVSVIFGVFLSLLGIKHQFLSRLFTDLPGHLVKDDIRL